MDSAIRIALMLTAVDRATSVINRAFGGMLSAANRANTTMVDNATTTAKKLSGAYASIRAGQAGFNFLGDTVDAFAAQEEAANLLKSNMMSNGGLLDEGQWKRVQTITNDLGNKLPGSTADMIGLFNSLKEGGVQMTDILNGTGAAAANLAVVTHQTYDAAAKSAAILQNASGVTASDMNAFFDDLSRSSGLGVKMNNLEDAFSNAAAGMKLLKIQGLEASKTMSSIFGVLDRNGLKGGTAGTNVGRILAEISDPKKVSGLNAMAKQYGIALSFFDKKGNFAGPENMVAQFTKLQNLNAQQLSKVLRPLTGNSGQDDNIVKMLSMGGSAKIAAFAAEKQKAASMQMKLDQQLKGWNSQVEAFKGTITNLKAGIGASIVGMLNGLIPKLTSVVAKFQTFIEQHPQLTKVAVAVMAVVSAALILNGTITLLKFSMGGLSSALTLISNPWFIVGAAVIAVALLIYKNWGAISGWFKNLWQGIKNVFSSVWNWIKNLFLNYTPAGLIIKYWEPIKGWFSNMWAGVKASFMGFMQFLFGWPAKLVQAGANIVSSIWQGIKNKWGEFMAWWHEKIQVIRDFLPFSPAKRGPLRDIHRIKLMETIAASIKPQPLINAMDSSLNSLSGMRKNRSAGGGGGSITYHFAPVINLYGGASKSDAVTVSKELEQVIIKTMKKEDERRRRASYSGE